MQNPWINYRRKKFNDSSKIQKKGTIIFFPKSISGVKVELKDLNKYISSIKKLQKNVIQFQFVCHFMISTTIIYTKNFVSMV